MMILLPARLRTLLLPFVASAAGLSGADTPTAPAATPAPTTASAPAVQSVAPDAASPTPATPAPTQRLLKQILIGESVPAVEAMTPVPGGTFVILGPTLPKLDSAELNRRLASGLDRPIEERLLAAIAQVIENFFRQFDYPAAQAIVPTQNIADGVLRVILLPGNKSEPVTAASQWKIRKINMQGTRWFSESLLREKLRIEQGGIVKWGELDQAIGWTNNNPYRRVKVKLDPVPNTGEADLTIAVAEAMPLRVVAAYDNTGNQYIGRNRYTAALAYGNLWGRDHQISYQFMTTDQPRYFKGHGFDYRMPLPWRHYLQLSASYVRARPEFYGGEITQDGETITGDLRYSIPLRTGENPAEIYTAFNFKESNNNLAYGGTSVQATKTDIFQITTGASMVKRDKRGAWAFGGSFTASPGDVNSRNSDVAFDASRYGPGDSARFGARAAYLYASLTFQRVLILRPGWDLFSRGTVQGSTTNLLPSEQLSIGGASSVRGYRENVFSGDHGYVVSNEILSPILKLNVPRLPKTRGALETRFVAFVDAGDTKARRKFLVDQRRVFLASAGLGLRMNLATNFSLTADYGWQLQPLPYKSDEHSRGHIKATLAY